MPRYIVSGPWRTYMEIVCEFGGPTYDVRDCYMVDAPNKKKAAWAAFNESKRRNTEWYADLEKHPLSGVEIEKVEGVSNEGWEQYYIKVEE